MKNIATKTLIIVFLFSVCLASAGKAIAQAAPLDVKEYLDLGNAHATAGRYQEAIEAFKQAIKLKPDLAEAHFCLGYAYEKLGRYQEMSEACKQAIKLKPDLAEAHYGLGVAYSHSGRWQEAIKAFKLTIKLKPDYAGAHYNLGVAYGKLGRYQEASEAYKQAIKLKPDDAEAHNNLGVAYVNIGDKRSALEEYKILKPLNLKLANKLFLLVHSTFVSTKKEIDERVEAAAEIEKWFKSHLGWVPIIKIGEEDKTVLIMQSIRFDMGMTYGVMNTENKFVYNLLLRTGYKKVVFIQQIFNENEAVYWEYNIP